MPNIHMNQVAFSSSIQKTPTTPFHNHMNTTNRTPQQTYRSTNQRRAVHRNSDLSESDSDSDSMLANNRRVDNWSSRENVPLRRSARRVRAVRHDPDFVVDFDEDDDDEDVKADDSDNFDPNDEIHGSSKRYTGSQRRSQVSVHLNAARSTTANRNLPQYDGVGDTTDEEDIDAYEDEVEEEVEEEEEVVVDDDLEDEEMMEDYVDEYIDDDDDDDGCDVDDDGGEYYYDNDELEEDEVIEDDDEEDNYDDDDDDDDEYYPVFSRKRELHLKSKHSDESTKLSVIKLPCSTNSIKSDSVPVAPKVVILKNNTLQYIQGNTTTTTTGNTTVKNKDNSNNNSNNNTTPRILSIPASAATSGQQRIILPAKLNKTSTITSETSTMLSKTITLGNVKEAVGQALNLPLPTTTTSQPSVNMPQGLRLVRIVRNPDGGTNIIPVCATDTILPSTQELSNVNQTVDNSIIISQSGVNNATSQSDPVSSLPTTTKSNNPLDNGDSQLVVLSTSSNTTSLINNVVSLSKPLAVTTTTTTTTGAAESNESK
ncbi:unnamed protein product, partial [Schistosoma turkestanicum]